jgi:hypothetical protein
MYVNLLICHVLCFIMYILVFITKLTMLQFLKTQSVQNIDWYILVLITQLTMLQFLKTQSVQNIDRYSCFHHAIDHVAVLKDPVRPKH